MKEQLYRKLEPGSILEKDDIGWFIETSEWRDPGKSVGYGAGNGWIRPVSTETATGSVQESEAERLKLLREHYAGLAMQGLCANSELATKSANVVALYAAQQADALIAALNKKEEEV